MSLFSCLWEQELSLLEELGADGGVAAVRRDGGLSNTARTNEESNTERPMQIFINHLIKEALREPLNNLAPHFPFFSL